MQEIHFRLTFVSQKRVGSTPVSLPRSRFLDVTQRSPKRKRERLDSRWQYTDFFLRTACVMDMTEELKIFLMS